MNYDKGFKELMLGHNNGFITFDEVVENQILLVIKYKIVLGRSK